MQTPILRVMCGPEFLFKFINLLSTKMCMPVYGNNFTRNFIDYFDYLTFVVTNYPQRLCHGQILEYSTKR